MGFFSKKFLGEVNALDVDHLLKNRQLALDRKRDLVGEGSWDGVWDFGLPLGWRGLPLEEIPSREKKGSLSFDLVFPSLLDSVDLDYPFRPSFIRGNLSRASPINDFTRIAVTVNGKVATRAAVWSKASGNGEEFAALVPPEFFVSGANTVGIVAYEDLEEGAMLIGSGVSDRRTLRWVHRQGSDVIVSQSGRREREIKTKASLGSYRLNHKNGRWRIAGWVARGSRKNHPNKVAVFANRHFIRICYANQKPKFGQQPDGTNKGFSCEIPKAEVEKNGIDSIHAIALYRSEAAMLRRDTQVPWGGPRPD